VFYSKTLEFALILKIKNGIAP